MPFTRRNWSSAEPMKPEPAKPEPLSMPANHQDKSPLFTTLPIEIRRHIYKQLWLDCGLNQHIFAFTDKAYLQSFPCVLSPEELDQDPSPPPVPRPDAAGVEDDADVADGSDASPDDDNDDQDQSQPQPQDDPGDINSALQDLSAGGADGNEEHPPNNTPWCAHYACFRRWGQKWEHSFSRMYRASYRHSRGLPDLAGSPVLTAFLVCRRLYKEASESLFSSVRFSFASLASLRVFVGQVPRPLVARVQFADIVAADLGFSSHDPVVDNRTSAQQVYETLKASFPNLRELRLTLHPSRSGEVVPGRHALEPLYALAREMHVGGGGGSLRRLEVFLPTRCDDNSEFGYGEAPASLRDDALPAMTVKIVPPGWHEVNDCAPFDCPIRSLGD